MNPPTKKNPNLMPSNTVLLMITQEQNSVPQKLLMAKLSPDLTQLPFPMVVSKLLPTLLIIITVMLLMSNTKELPSTLRPNLTTQHLLTSLLLLMHLPQLPLPLPLPRLNNKKDNGIS
jgi:hypothetical protein